MHPPGIKKNNNNNNYCLQCVESDCDFYPPADTVPCNLPHNRSHTVDLRAAIFPGNPAMKCVTECHIEKGQVETWGTSREDKHYSR